MDRPSSVKIGVALMLASMALGLVSVSLNIASAPEHYSRPVMIVGSGVLLSISGALAYLLYVGKNWARIVFAIFGVYAIVTGVNGPNPLGVHHPFVVTSHWFGMAATVAVLVALFVPASSRWYKSQKTDA